MKPKVLIKNCQAYDPYKISVIIYKGMEELDVLPWGHTLVKPNTVIAHQRYYPHAFTRPEFLEGLFVAIKQRGRQLLDKITLGERCGITIPTRYSFLEAGYYPVLKRHQVEPCYFEEVEQVKVSLDSPPALRPFIYVPKPVVDNAFFISAPKFKAHPWTKVTFSLKNLIGIQDDKHRLIDHDYKLEMKIADLQQVVTPGFIAVDAITAGQKTMLTPVPFKLGLIIMGTNSVAVDAVCTKIAGLEPKQVDHIDLCAQRGMGPIDLDQIEISGDVSLDEAMKRTKGFELTLGTVEDIFNKPSSNITVSAGPPPEPEQYNYCWGGCTGALFEGVQIIEAMQPRVYQEVRPMHIAFGDLSDREIKVKGQERVLFMGDCAKYKGEIAGESVDIACQYTPRDQKDPHCVKSQGLISKIIKYLIIMIANWGKTVIRVPGCPVSVAENVLFVSHIGRTKNPYLDLRVCLKFTYCFLISKMVILYRGVARWIGRIF